MNSLRIGSSFRCTFFSTALEVVSCCLSSEFTAGCVSSVMSTLRFPKSEADSAVSLLLSCLEPSESEAEMIWLFVTFSFPSGCDPFVFSEFSMLPMESVSTSHSSSLLTSIAYSLTCSSSIKHMTRTNLGLTTVFEGISPLIFALTSLIELARCDT